LEHGVATLAQGLITAWALVVVAFVALAILASVAIRSRTRSVDLENAVLAFRSLDIGAFRNLIDPNEEAFLRDHLPPQKFREIKRQRAWAAILYAWEVGGAASALAQLGQAAQRSADPITAASGVQLSENAFRLRLQSIRACLRLVTGIILPDLRTQSIPTLVDQYERASENLLRLGRFSSVSPEFARSKSA
jgi:hypothetical protein